MDKNSQKFKVRLGMFITGGIVLFILAIFIIGKQKNLFNPVFRLTTTFYNISGLQVGNNVRFSGINVGTVNNIYITNDSTITVEMLLRKNVQKFIKSDSEVSIGSEGLIGDKLMIINQGSNGTVVVHEGQQLESKEPVEMEDIMASIQITAVNAAIISGHLAEIMTSISLGKGTLGRLIQDSTIAENLNQTVNNLKKSSKGLNENMNAVKENFLFRGYYKRQEKAAKLKADSMESRQKRQK
jgi:phospholipid/cholesterol/gamma-HCH transport system substrate-binding protein